MVTFGEPLEHVITLRGPLLWCVCVCVFGVRWVCVVWHAGNRRV